MEMLKWRSFTLISFYLIYLFTCYNDVSATSAQIMSNTKLGTINLENIYTKERKMLNILSIRYVKFNDLLLFFSYFHISFKKIY